MKYRLSFVTNSSSSSFVCDVCGNSEGGYDVSMRDCGMVECENGHTLCNHHMESMSKEELIKFILENEYSKSIRSKERNSRGWYDYTSVPYIQEELDDMDKDDIENIITHDYIPAIMCPICSMSSFEDSDLLKYILKERKQSSDDVMKEIRERFGTYDNFKNYID